jgi:hypothetical protein
VELPEPIREELIDDLEEFLSNLPDDPDAEMVANFMIEQLEIYAEERGIEDIVVKLEESGALDSSLRETLESEMASNEDFEFTEEECVDLLETITDIEWVEEEEDEDYDDDDFEEEEEILEDL